MRYHQGTVSPSAFRAVRLGRLLVLIDVLLVAVAFLVAL